MSESICRTCLAQASGSIFKTVFLDEKELSLVDMLNVCTGLMVTESDGISLNICDVCTEEIIKSYVYRTKCWDSQNLLLRRLEERNQVTDSIKCEAENDDITYEIVLFSGIKHEEQVQDIGIKHEEQVQDVSVIPKKTEPTVKCPLCDETYSSKNLMQEHLRHVHSTPDDKDPIKIWCHHCGQKLKNWRNFILHVQRQSGEKPYKCDLCEYRAAQRASITSHMRTHTGERPYECIICGDVFPSSSARTKHYKCHSEGNLSST